MSLTNQLNQPTRSSGCGDEACLLCRNNADRRCQRHLQSKYAVEDLHRAKCVRTAVLSAVSSWQGCLVAGCLKHTSPAHPIRMHLDVICFYLGSWLGCAPLVKSQRYHTPRLAWGALQQYQRPDAA